MAAIPVSRTQHAVEEPPDDAVRLQQVKDQMERMCEAYGIEYAEGAQKLLAEQLGESKSTVGSWVARRSIPLHAFSKCVQDTGRTLDWVIRGVFARKELEKSIVEQGVHKKLKISSPQPETSMRERGSGSWTLRADVGGDSVFYTLVPKLLPVVGEVSYTESGPVGELAFRREWMERQFGRSDGFVLVDVGGDSMSPTFRDGDAVLVDRTQREVNSGGIFVVRRGEEFIVRRIHRQLSGALQITADNATVLPELLSIEVPIEIVGRVVWPRS